MKGPAAAALVAFLALGCGGGSSSGPGAEAGACTVTSPSTCPSPEPSYANDVAPILAAECTPCHAPGGVEASRDLQSWGSVSKQLSSVRTQIATCRMPQDGRAMSEADREKVLAWIVCGAKND